MEIQKIPAENHQKKTTTIIDHINRANRLGKANNEWKDVWYRTQSRGTDLAYYDDDDDDDDDDENDNDDDDGDNDVL